MRSDMAQPPAHRAYGPEGGPGFDPPPRGDMGDNVYQQCSGFRFRVSDIKVSSVRCQVSGN